MNAMFTFIHDVILGTETNSKPVGLTSFRDVKTKPVVEKKHAQKNEIKISDLMRRVH